MSVETKIYVILYSMYCLLSFSIQCPAQKKQEDLRNTKNNSIDVAMELKQLKESKANILKERESILFAIDSLNDKNVGKENKRLRLLNCALKNNLKKEVGIDTLFIKRHAHSLAGLDVLYSRSLKQPEIPIKDLMRFFNALSHEIRNAEKGKRLKNILERNMKTQVGYQAPSFSLVDIKKEVIIGGSFNKYILLDFWASWCIPCRKEFLKLKELYKKYSTNFEIIGISLDKDTGMYHKAIMEEGIDIWTNGLINNHIKEVFYIPAIPMKYLINKNGKIIGRWRGGGEKNMLSLMKLLKENYDFE